jgi:hypothetical protein
MNHQEERALVDALRAMRASMEADEAPVRVEAALVAALRRKKKQRKMLRWSAVGGLAAGLALLAVALRTPEVNAPAQVAASPPLPDGRGSETMASSRNPKTLTPPRIPPPKPSRRPAPRHRAPELLTPFVPFLYADDLGRMDRGQVVRVRLPGTALASFGFAVSEERLPRRIQADILLGEDGMARAIRFVQ